MTRQEAQKILGVSKATMIRLLNSGKIKAKKSKSGRQDWTISKDELDRFISENGKQKQKSLYSKSLYSISKQITSAPVRYEPVNNPGVIEELLKKIIAGQNQILSLIKKLMDELVLVEDAPIEPINEPLEPTHVPEDEPALLSLFKEIVRKSIYTQVQFSRMVGLNPKTVSKVMTDKPVQKETLQKIYFIVKYKKWEKK